MRALPLFLALFAITASLQQPALVVLRAACPLRDSTAFDLQLLSRHIVERRPAHRATTRAVRILPRVDTCGPDWRRTVTRGALSALATGGIVESVGWPGAGACETVAAAARVLRRPQPAICVALVGWAATVLELGARFSWASALVMSAPSSSECDATLRQIARALTEAGLEVRRGLDILNGDTSTWLPHVVIRCVSTITRFELVPSVEKFGAELLLLHVEEASPFATDFTAKFSLDSKSVGVGEDNTSRKKPPLDSSRAELIISDEPVAAPKRLYWEYGIIDDQRRNVPEERRYATETDSKTELDSDWDPAGPLARVLADLAETPSSPLLMLAESEEKWKRHTRMTVTRVHDEALRAVDAAADAERSRQQTARTTFSLYGRGTGGTSREGWRRLALINAESTRSLDDGSEWKNSIRVVESHGTLGRWVRARARSSEWEGGRTMLGAGAAALALLTGVVLALRWRTVWTHGGRGRGDAVLLPADFSFPVDEIRCVGDGMETMLSCWLQQLHEFGGPELERPDLLKWPVGGPLVTSAPSSTCSVNRISLDRRTRYKGDAVFLKRLPTTSQIELKGKAADVLLVMQNLRHENVNPFVGCLCEVRPSLVFEHCWRGSLEDVLTADEIKLDWTFRLSLLTDLVKGMRYLHASPVRAHGRLSSRNCLVDSRWLLRITDYGLPAFMRAQALLEPARPAREMLWSAPELLREVRAGATWRATQSGDVFSFAIIMQEVIVRGEPYCMLALTPEEIVDKLCRPPPLIRPSVSMGAAPPEAISVMRQCWSELPDLRPDFDRLHDVFRHLHRGRKINIVDSMFEMLEKYSNNLEELIKERTEQLDMEKKKTEQLLNRMLPRSVAERLMLGSRVEPEEFEEVSIYFSDIVGFTALAARSTPVQVVDLLNDLYTTFDAAIEQYRVYKVETIGDAYMVVGGLPTRARDHAESVATMALHLLHLAGRFRVRHLPDTPLHLRIGLHSGPCCAAVVGLTMPRYCLFGDTVNTASRMESTGAAWRIQISAATAERLKAAGGYRLCSRGLTQVKGKGAMHTYWLLGKEGFDRPLPTPPPLEFEEEALTGMEVEGDAKPRDPQTPRRLSADADRKVDTTESPPDDASALQAAGEKERRFSVEGGLGGVQPPRTVPFAVNSDHSSQYARYRWLPGGVRPLRRQWSLERGDTLAVAAASDGPLTLLTALPAPSRAPRYRMRRDAHVEEPGIA